VNFNSKLAWRVLVGVASIALVTMICGCRKAESALSDPADAKSVVEGNTAFALGLYQQLKTQPGNLFFSPYSISSALAMACAGARGQTESEMACVLHFSQAAQDNHAASATLAARLKEIQRRNRVTVAVANSLWCERDYPFTDAFLNLTRSRYEAEVHLVDFKNTAESSRSEINSWVERKTQGRINELIGPGQLTDAARLVLCNAIYFKGKWAIRFDPKRTQLAPFFTSPVHSLRVPMMEQESEFKRMNADDISLLELRYTDDDLSMIILLPDANNGLHELESRISMANLSKWLAELDRARPAKLAITLPRFKTTQAFELAKELSALGMPSAFGRGADFSGMSRKRDLSISDVVHKAYVEVNEEGTEAAAATGIEVYLKGMPREFRADHPFLFLIRENQTGGVLFLGRIVDPSR
jgi:serpin B